MSRAWRAAAVTLAFVRCATWGLPALAQEPVVVVVDKSEILSLPGEPFHKVAVTNPSVAEVVVVSPTQIVLNGKAPGVTTLLVFYAKSHRGFEVSVQPPPMAAPSTATTHTVVVQKGDRLSTHQFYRGPNKYWIELGPLKRDEAPGAEGQKR